MRKKLMNIQDMLVWFSFNPAHLCLVFSSFQVQGVRVSYRLIQG